MQWLFLQKDFEIISSKGRQKIIKCFLCWANIAVYGNARVRSVLFEMAAEW